VVVYLVPGFSGNHLLSIVGEPWKAVLSKLIADPGPHSVGASAVAVGDADADDDAGSEVLVDVDWVLVDVDCACPTFGAAHDATVEIVRSSAEAELRADSRLFGWNITVAFAVFIAASNRHRPPFRSSPRGSAVEKNRARSGAIRRCPRQDRGEAPKVPALEHKAGQEPTFGSLPWTSPPNEDVSASAAPSVHTIRVRVTPGRP
jgi:hypothetical protein